MIDIHDIGVISDDDAKDYFKSLEADYWIDYYKENPDLR